MNRRQFFGSLVLLAAGCKLNVSAQELFQVRMTDPGCSPELFEATYEELRKLQGLDDGLSDKQRLAKARAWLGGSPEFRPKLAASGRWSHASFEGRELAVRVLEPPGRSRGVVLSIHGGGWTMGCASSDEAFNAELARTQHVTVVSPEYRLAPEHPYPAAPDDCELVARWLLADSKKEFATTRLGIIGFSAGSHLAALTLTRLSVAERERFRRAIFFYGVFDLARNERWRAGTDETYPDLSPSSMNLCLKRFAPNTSDEERSDPRYSPLNADLGNMPPALFLVGSADLLYPDTRKMAEKWGRSGNPAELVTYQGAPHGFNGYEIEWKLNPNIYARRFMRL